MKVNEINLTPTELKLLKSLPGCFHPTNKYISKLVYLKFIGWKENPSRNF